MRIIWQPLKQTKLYNKDLITRACQIGTIVPM